MIREDGPKAPWASSSSPWHPTQEPYETGQVQPLSICTNNITHKHIKQRNITKRKVQPLSMTQIQDAHYEARPAPARKRRVGPPEEYMKEFCRMCNYKADKLSLPRRRTCWAGWGPRPRSTTSRRWGPPSRVEYPRGPMSRRQVASHRYSKASNSPNIPHRLETT